MSALNRIEHIRVITERAEVAASYLPGTTKRTSLLVHGLGGAKEHFSEAFGYAHKNHLFAPDLPGFGESSRLSDPALYTPEVLARAISQSMKPELKEDVTLILHSMASMIAEELCKNMSVSKIYLIEGNLLNEDCNWSNQICSMDQDRYFAYFHKLQVGSEMLFRQILNCKEQAKIKKWSEAFTKMDSEAFLQTAHCLLEATTHGEIFNWLSTVECPVCYIRGARSGHWSGVDHIISCGWDYVVVPESGHFPMLDNPSFVFGKAIML